MKIWDIDMLLYCNKKIICLHEMKHGFVMAQWLEKIIVLSEREREREVVGKGEFIRSIHKHYIFILCLVYCARLLLAKGKLQCNNKNFYTEGVV